MKTCGPIVLTALVTAAIGCGSSTTLPQTEADQRPIALIRSRDPDLRKAAAIALYRTPTGHEQDRLLLIGIAKDEPDPDIRTWVSLALVRMGCDDRGVISAIVKGARSEDPELRINVAIQLGDLTDDRLVPCLTTLLEDSSPYVRREAARSLGKKGEDASTAVPSLIASLQDDGTDVPIFAAEALGQIGPSAKDAVRALLDIVDKEDVHESYKRAAIMGLGGIGLDAKCAVPSIIREMATTPSLTRVGIVALGNIGADPDLVVPVLIRHLADSNGPIRYASVMALGRYGSNAEAAVPRLLAALDDAYLRLAAIDALGHIGPPAISAVSALERFQKDNDPSVASSADAAVRKIKGSK